MLWSGSFRICRCHSGSHEQRLLTYGDVSAATRSQKSEGAWLPMSIQISHGLIFTAALAYLSSILEPMKSPAGRAVKARDSGVAIAVICSNGVNPANWP